jgi:SAM-dependent methyltransferase
LTDASVTGATIFAAIGDRLGLWKDLAARGPATSAAFAARTGLAERHVREWLRIMATAGYLRHCPESQTFCLPPEHAPALAEEGGAMFFGGVYEILLGCLRPIEQLIEGFKTGAGVPQSAYPDSTYEGMARFSSGWYENLLLPIWIPGAGLHGALADGIDVADVGCGRGRALIKLAEAYPRSRFVGYDAYGPNVARARQRAEKAGMAGRVRFVELDAARGLPESADLVTTFDVVHDAVDPPALLAAIRRALRPGGRYLCLEVNCSERLEDMIGPAGTFFHTASLLYCMPTSLAGGGAALGACGLHEPRLRELAAQAGFGGVARVPVDDPFNALYLLTA